MKGFIYEIRDLNSKRIYVGSSKKARLSDRISDHLYSYKTKRPINSRLIFDGNNWEAKIIEEVEYTKKIELLLREQSWLDDLKDDDNYELVNGVRAVAFNSPKILSNQI
tara:strand:+ start:291 stop:617 length:327 start_codon:yes stop_codon:yes gene_type:complete